MRARPSARVILIDGRNRVLLLRVEDPPNLGAGDFWILPGGGLEQGETFEEAARRELREETGIRTAMWGPCVWTLELRLTLNREDILSQERYFLARVSSEEVILDHQIDTVELAHYRGHSWWAVDAMVPSAERFLPPGLPDLLAPLAAGVVPAEPIAIR